MTARSLATTTATVGFLALEMFQEIDVLQMIRASDTVGRIALVLNAQSSLLNSCTENFPYWHQLMAEHYYYQSQNECSQLQAQSLKPIKSSRILLKHARLVYPEKSMKMTRYLFCVVVANIRRVANIVVLLQLLPT